MARFDSQDHSMNSMNLDQHDFDLTEQKATIDIDISSMTNNMATNDITPEGLEMELVSLTNGWNDKNERMVITIGENSASYKWMHEKSANLYKLLHQILSIVLIVFSTGLSAGTFFPAGDQEASDNLALRITQQIFTYVVTVVSVLQNFFKFQTLAEQHTASAAEFGKLYYDIQQQMCMYRRDRKGAQPYLSSVLKTYDNLIVNGPSIADYTVRQFKQTFQNGQFAMPDIADSIQRIEVVVESDPSGTSGNAAGVRSLKKPDAQQPPPEVPEPPKPLYAKSGLCNLQQIHEAFQTSDPSDSDANSAIQLRELRRKHLDKKTQYEFDRFRQHSERQ